MWIFLLSVALVGASGPPVDIPDPTVCIASSGYLSGLDFGEDCCSFVVCDAARLNKTGFVGKCMGGTAWNNDLLVCDDPKYVTPECDPTTCTVPKRTTALCADPLEAGTCCVNGYEPVFEAVNETVYKILPDGVEQSCPDGQVFNTEDCCCEFDYTPVAPCDEDLEIFYYENPDDPCCTYIQCYQNRTGFTIVPCMPPSVWNDDVKACDLAVKVMPCMNTLCGDEVTDPPCPDPTTLPDGECCMAGIFYEEVPEDDTMYQIKGDDKISCCPVDAMTDVQLVFNIDDCCCEPPAQP